MDTIWRGTEYYNLIRDERLKIFRQNYTRNDALKNSHWKFRLRLYERNNRIYGVE